MSETKKRRTKGSGSIHLRADGRWEGTYTVGIDPGTGKQKRKSVYGKTKKEVDQKLRKITVAIDENRYTDTQKMTVGQWLDRWLENAVLNVKPGTYADYKRNVELHLKPHLSKVQICALRPDDVQKVIKKLNGIALSAKTIKNILSCLHQALDYAVDNQLIPFNPASRRKLPKIVKKEIKPLDKPEQALFFNAIKGDEYECLYTVAVFTGMRSGELLGLTWNNVDFRNGTITVCQQLRPPRLKGEGYTIDTTKNGKTRVLNPAPSIMQMLKEHRKKQAEFRLKLGEKYNTEFPNLVFTYPDGRHLTQVRMWKKLQQVLHKAGLDPHRFHDLRHTYAVDCCMAGDDPKTVQDNLGHATSQFTLEVYAHTTETMKKESANRMEAFINSLHEDQKKQSETG